MFIVETIWGCRWTLDQLGSQEKKRGFTAWITCHFLEVTIIRWRDTVERYVISFGNTSLAGSSKPFLDLHLISQHPHVVSRAIGLIYNGGGFGLPNLLIAIVPPNQHSCSKNSKLKQFQQYIKKKLQQKQVIKNLKNKFHQFQSIAFTPAPFWLTFLRSFVQLFPTASQWVIISSLPSRLLRISNLSPILAGENVGMRWAT